MQRFSKKLRIGFLLVVLAVVSIWGVCVLRTPKQLPDFVESVRVVSVSGRVRAIYPRTPLRVEITDPKSVFYTYNRDLDPDVVCIGLELASYEVYDERSMFLKAGQKGQKNIRISSFNFGVPCTNVDRRTLWVAQQFLQQEPLNENGLKRLPIPEHVKLMLKLWFRETPLIVEVLPGAYRVMPAGSGARLEIEARLISIKESKDHREPGTYSIPIPQSF
ncbi:MAG: hypothetical protein Q7S28_04430 [bacterium]|nr:hypothetical protein [bacterium]